MLLHHTAWCVAIFWTVGSSWKNYRSGLSHTQGINSPILKHQKRHSDMDVSWNVHTPNKESKNTVLFLWFSPIKHPAIGVIPFLETPISKLSDYPNIHASSAQHACWLMIDSWIIHDYTTLINIYIYIYMYG